MSKESLEAAIKIAGGQSALGRLINKDQRTIWAWLNKTGRVPAEEVLSLEKALEGKITRHEFRADIYPIEDVNS